MPATLFACHDICKPIGRRPASRENRAKHDAKAIQNGYACAGFNKRSLEEKLQDFNETDKYV
jgi:hypothetical protein